MMAQTGTRPDAVTLQRTVQLKGPPPAGQILTHTRTPPARPDRGHTTMLASLVRYWDPFRKLMDLLELKAMLAVVAGIVSADREFVVACTILFIIDTITGVRAARERGEPITSNGLRRAGVKFVDYVLVGMAATAAARGFPVALGWLDGVAFLYIALTELVSITENVWPDRAPGLLRYLRRRLPIAKLLQSVDPPPTNTIDNGKPRESDPD